MKKILIATACAFSLCLTSCASKKAPADNAQTQTQAPELEENTSDQTEESQSEDTYDDSQNQDDQTDEAEVSLEIITDTFPEPESFEEPEVITLEPAEEAEPAETESQAPAEEVEKEEPPAIAEAEEKPEAEASSSDESENQNANEDSEITGPSDSDDDGITVIGGGIDITDDDSAPDEKYNENEEDIVPSRSVTLKKFEYLDITYPGTGWVYMGLIDNSKDLAYFGRKLGTKDTKFSLQARNAGRKIVHFYRNDPLTGKYLDDYIEVVILSENGSNKTHIEAPEYKLPVQKKENPVKKTQAAEEAEESEASEKSESTEKIEKSEVAKTSANTKTSATATSSKTTSNATSATTNAKPAASTAAATTSAKSDTSDAIEESTDEAQTMIATTTAVDSSTLLKEAQLLYDEKEYAASLKKLNQFFEYSTDNRDEALYLKGQILEAKSDVRDIKGAIDAYTTLTKNYPASKLWDSANKRIIYLKRFYLEVR